MVRFLGKQGILAAKDDGDIVLFSSDNLHEIQTFSAHDDIVSCVATDPRNDGQFLSCGLDGNMFLWDVHSKYGKHSPIGSYTQAHYGHINEVAYSHAHANLFCSVGYDGLLRVWDTRQRSSGSCSCIVNMGQIGSCVSFGTSGNDTTILAGTDAGDITVIDICIVASNSTTTVSTRSGEKINLTEASIEGGDDDTSIVVTGNNSNSVLSSSGVLSSTRIHRGRVRRIVSSPTATIASAVNAGCSGSYTRGGILSLSKGCPPGFTSITKNTETDTVSTTHTDTHNNRDNMFISASDDTTYAICTLNNTTTTNGDNNSNGVRELKRIAVHQDYVTDIAWVREGRGSSTRTTSNSKDIMSTVERMHDINDTDNNTADKDEDDYLDTNANDVIYSVSTDKSLQRNIQDIHALSRIGIIE